MDLDIASLPEEIKPYLKNASIISIATSRPHKTYFVDRDEGYFLKISSKDMLEHEATMIDYFYKKNLTAPVRVYISDDNSDYLLMDRVKGEICASERYMKEPEKLSAVVGASLRRLHDTDYNDCPKRGINTFIVPLAYKKYNENDLSLWLLDYCDYKNAQDAYGFLRANDNILVEDVCVHGDPGLTNILLDNFSFSGFIDFDGAGIGDRHFDLLWAIWSLGYNLKTRKYNDIFLDAYGRDKFDVDRYNLCVILRAFTFTESWKLRGKHYISSI